MKLILTIILFFIISIFNLRANSRNINPDSLKNVIKISKDRNEIKNSYFILIKYYTLKKDSNSIFLGNKYINFIKGKKNYLEIAESYQLLGNTYLVFQNKIYALDCFLRELNYREKLKPSTELVDVYINLGEINRAINSYLTSEALLKKAINRAKELNYEYGLARAYDRLAATYFEKNYKKNIYPTYKYAKLSLSISKEIKNYELMFSNYLLLGAYFIHSNKIDSGLISYKNSLNIIQKGYNIDEIPLVYHNIAHLYYRLNYNDTSFRWAYKAYNESKNRENNTYIWLSADLLSLLYKRLKIQDSVYKYQSISFSSRLVIFNEELSAEKDILYKKFFEEQMAEKVEIEKENTKMLLIIYHISFLVFIFLIYLFLQRNRRLKKFNNTLIQKNIIIEEQKNELKEINIQKDKFFSIISHDLKSPFTGLIGILELIMEKAETLDTKDIQKYIYLLYDSSKNVFKLLENLLEWSRLQQGLISINPGRINLSYIIHSVIQIFEMQIHNKELKITNNISQNIYIIFDENILNIIIRNLLSNAIKFTPKGGLIKFNVIIKNDLAEISISDSGIGIPEEMFHKLFKIHEKTSRYGTEGEPSTGLGLLLCKEYIEKSGSTLSVQSEVGIGTTFTFIAPLAEFEN